MQKKKGKKEKSDVFLSRANQLHNHERSRTNDMSQQEKIDGQHRYGTSTVQDEKEKTKEHQKASKRQGDFQKGSRRPQQEEKFICLYLAQLVSLLLY